MNTRTGPPAAGMQRAGGIAALYVAVAYLAANPYFVLLVDYPSATDPVTKVALLRDNLTSMYLMHVVCFQFARDVELLFPSGHGYSLEMEPMGGWR